MTMHFRKMSIADSVMERISAIADSVRTDAPLPTPRGAAVISLDRQENGDLMVTKSFENGETELLTISNQQSSSTQPPEGLVQIASGDEQTGEQELAPGPEGENIVQSAALGGDSLDALLRT